MGTRKLRGGMPPPKKASKAKTFDSIFEAINGGTVAQLKAYLEANPQSVNEIGIDGNTPLHFAVDKYVISKVKLMLDAYRDVNADRNVKNNAGNSPFLGLCEYSTDVDTDKSTYEIFMLFFNTGVNYNVQNAKGETAFMVFLRKNNLIRHRNSYVEKIYDMFLSKALNNLMDLNIKNNDNENVLFYLIRNIPVDSLYNDIYIITLINAGIDVNVVNNKGVTALFILIEEYKKNNIPDMIKIMDAFVNKGYEINKLIVTTAISVTPFVSVVLPLTDQNITLNHRLKELARNMLNRYVIDVNIKTMRDLTALHILSKHNYKELVQLVLEKGANINAQTDDGATPLMYAVYDNRIEIVKLLLEKGADRKLKNKDGKTAYDVARTEEMKELLNPKKREKEKPYKGFSKSDMEIYDALFENPKDWSICPVCLSFSERKEGCMIMGHDCAKQDIFYHKDLYKKYAFENEYGNIVEWCTICGRVCKNHKHYTLSLPEDTTKLAIITPAMEARMRERGTGVYFEDGNCIGLGGGGIEEKVARFRRLREYAGELQEQVGKINNTKARTELIEEIWKAPLFKTKKYKEILEKKKLNINTNVFPERIANNVEEEKVYRNVPFPAARKYPIKMGTEPECVIQGAVDESVSVKYQFQHQDVEGGSNHNGMYICNEDIENYIEQKNKAFGTAEFGKCWLPNCSAKIYPEEVKAIISKPIYEDYKKKFNKKFGVVVDEEEEVAPLRVEIPPINPNMLQIHQWVEEQIPILVAEHRERVERQLELLEEDPEMRDEIEDYIVQYIEEFNVADDINEHDVVRYAVTKGYDAGLYGIYGLKILVEGALDRYRDFNDLRGNNNEALRLRRAAQAQRGPPVLAVAENAFVPEDPIVLQIEEWIDEQLPIIAGEHPEQVARQLEFIENNPLRIQAIIEGLINDYIDEAGGEERVPEALRGIIGYATTRGYKSGFLRESGLDTLVNAAIASFIDFDEAREEVRRQLGNNARGGRMKHNTRKKGKKGKKSRRGKQRGGDIEHVFHKLDLDSAVCLPFLKA